MNKSNVEFCENVGSDEELTDEEEEIIESLSDLQLEFEEIMTEVRSVIGETKEPEDLSRLFARALTIQNELLKCFFRTLSSRLNRKQPDQLTA